MSNLVIVESPTKAKTISKFLGKNYKVESSFGHIRDLPKSKLGVDVDKEFEPTYVVPPKAKAVAAKLKTLAAKADEIYFATDEDREGEAITWHLMKIIKPKAKKINRIVFHEITKEAITEAIKNPRDLDMNLVDAQQARRILDRLVGYKLSPFLWKKIARGLSAGRVQSVAVRLIVEREREVEKFQPEEYWTIDAIFSKNGQNFQAKLAKINGKTVDKLEIKNQAQAQEILDKLNNSQYRVIAVEEKEVSRHPLPPFTTSTLQQTANHRLGFSAKQTMMLAQQLYEGVELGSSGSVGLITYMRTDSLNLSQKFLGEAQTFIKSIFGETYSNGPKFYKTKAKGAQEAHEAIRPTYVSYRPEEIKEHLNPNQSKLYTLIWERAVASQMSPARLKATAIDINDQTDGYTFRANGSVIVFDGFLKIYSDSVKENLLPAINKNDQVKAEEIKPNQHFTQPPPRYTEATLVKALEELGIGRPSTYAPTISTIQERNYVAKEDKKLKPTDIGKLVNDLLVEHFNNIVDYQFTARMESDLDEVADGHAKWQQIIGDFYTPFAKNLKVKEKELTKEELVEQTTDAVCMKCGKPMVVKIGRFGKFLACSGYPECKNTQQINGKGEAEPAEMLEETCPQCGKPLTKRRSRFGEFIGCSGYPDCKYIKREPPKIYAQCPVCNQGNIVAKRSRRGVFYSCDRYPECKTAFWAAPTGEKCPQCQSLLLFGKDGKVVCSNKECKFEK